MSIYVAEISLLTEHEYALAEYIMYSILPLYLVDETFAVLTELIKQFHV